MAPAAAIRAHKTQKKKKMRLMRTKCLETVFKLNVITQTQARDIRSQMGQSID